MPKLGNDRFGPELHMGGDVCRFVKKDVFCRCNVLEHFHAVFSVGLAVNISIAQKVAVNVKVIIDIERVVHKLEAVCKARQSQFNENYLVFVNRFSCRSSVCGRKKEPEGIKPVKRIGGFNEP